MSDTNAGISVFRPSDTLTFSHDSRQGSRADRTFTVTPSLLVKSRGPPEAILLHDDPSAEDQFRLLIDKSFRRRFRDSTRSQAEAAQKEIRLCGPDKATAACMEELKKNLTESIIDSIEQADLWTMEPDPDHPPTQPSTQLVWWRATEPVSRFPRDADHIYLELDAAYQMRGDRMSNRPGEPLIAIRPLMSARCNGTGGLKYDSWVQCDTEGRGGRPPRIAREEAQKEATRVRMEVLTAPAEKSYDSLDALATALHEEGLGDHREVFSNERRPPAQQ